VRTRFERLSAEDLTNLAVEAADTPMHIGVVAVLDDGSLLDRDGQLRLADLLPRIEDGLDRVPLLRKVVYRPGVLAGRPVWVDDPAFTIDRHVSRVGLDPPGGEDQLLRLTERLMQPTLDRSRPLWRIWFVTGMPDGRVAVVVKLHHAIADGLAAVRLIATLLDPPTADARSTDPPWLPTPPPRWRDLFRDNVSTRASAAKRLTRRLAHPAGLRRALWSAAAGWRSVTRAWAAPRTSVNAPIGPRRRIAVVRLDLAQAKDISHGYGGKVNDLVLDLIAGGLRALLVARGEPVDGLVLHTAVAVSLRIQAEADRAGNRAGIVVVRLPLHEPDPGARLRTITTETAAAKRSQLAANEQHLMVFLARAGLMRYFTRRQRLTNLIESNVTGPPEPIRVLGAPVQELIPVGVIAGNLTIAFLAFSYAGWLTVTVWCDAERFPDLPVLVQAMNRDWAELVTRSATAAGYGDGNVS
jgi:diacylglycerol O-acyltransferase / wax synthase